MAFPYGFSFLPNGDGEYRRPQSGGSPLQQAIQVLSLRVPRVVGSTPLAPLSLLTSQGGAGMPEGLLRRMEQSLPGANAPTQPPVASLGAPPPPSPGQTIIEADPPSRDGQTAPESPFPAASSASAVPSPAPTAGQSLTAPVSSPMSAPAGGGVTMGPPSPSLPMMPSPTPAPTVPAAPSPLLPAASPVFTGAQTAVAPSPPVFPEVVTRAPKVVAGFVPEAPPPIAVSPGPSAGSVVRPGNDPRQARGQDDVVRRVAEAARMVAPSPAPPVSGPFMVPSPPEPPDDAWERARALLGQLMYGRNWMA